MYLGKANTVYKKKCVIETLYCPLNSDKDKMSLIVYSTEKAKYSKAETMIITAYFNDDMLTPQINYIIKT